MKDEAIQCDHIVGYESNYDQGYDLLFQEEADLYPNKITWLDEEFKFCPRCGKEL